MPPRYKEHAIDTPSPHTMQKHYKITNGKKESSEWKEKTEQKLRPTMKQKKLHTSYEKTKKKIVYEKKRCSFTMLVHGSSKKGSYANMHTLPCKYHCDGLDVVVILVFFFIQSRAAPSFSTLSCFDRQHTDRHHFSRALFFRCCYCYSLGVAIAAAAAAAYGTRTFYFVLVVY